MWLAVAGCSMAVIGSAAVIGWWLRGSTPELPRPVFELPPATARKIRRQQKRQRADLRSMLQRNRY